MDGYLFALEVDGMSRPPYAWNSPSHAQLAEKHWVKTRVLVPWATTPSRWQMPNPIARRHPRPPPGHTPLDPGVSNDILPASPGRWPTTVTSLERILPKRCRQHRPCGAAPSFSCLLLHWPPSYEVLVTRYISVISKKMQILVQEKCATWQSFSRNQIFVQQDILVRTKKNSTKAIIRTISSEVWNWTFSCTRWLPLSSQDSSLSSYPLLQACTANCKKNTEDVHL